MDLDVYDDDLTDDLDELYDDRYWELDRRVKNKQNSDTYDKPPPIEIIKYIVERQY